MNHFTWEHICLNNPSIFFPSDFLSEKEKNSSYGYKNKNGVMYELGHFKFILYFRNGHVRKYCLFL